MGKWIRFEDKYGAFTIFQQICGNISLTEQGVLGYCVTDTYINFGISTRWKMLSKLECDTVRQLNIDEIYLVFDIDNLQGNKDEILDVEDILNTISDYKTMLPDVKVYYMPIIYAAETLALTQFCDISVNPVEMYSTVNTNELQVNLLKLLVGKNNRDYIKKMGNYINIHKILHWIQAQDLTTNLQSVCFTWLLHNCEINQTYFMDAETVVDFVKMLQKWWDNCKDRAKDFIIFLKGNKIVASLPVNNIFKVYDNSEIDNKLVCMTNEMVNAKIYKIDFMKYRIESESSVINVYPKNVIANTSGTIADAIKDMKIQ